MTSTDEFILTLKKTILAVESLKGVTHFLNKESLKETDEIMKQFNEPIIEIIEAIDIMTEKIKSAESQ